MQPEDGKATASLVLGILGLFCCGWLFGIIAIVLSTQAKKAGNTSGKVTAGFILGIVDIVLWAILLVVSMITGAFSNLLEQASFILPYLG